MTKWISFRMKVLLIVIASVVIGGTAGIAAL